MRSALMAVKGDGAAFKGRAATASSLTMAGRVADWCRMPKETEARSNCIDFATVPTQALLLAFVAKDAQVNEFGMSISVIRVGELVAGYGLLILPCHLVVCWHTRPELKAGRGCAVCPRI